MAVNKKGKLLLTEEERRQIPKGFHYLLEYKEELDYLLEAQLDKIEKIGVYFRNSDKLSISDWQARRG